MLDAEFIPTSIKLVPVIFSLTGAISSYILYTFGQRALFELKISPIGRGLYNFLNRKWFFDKVYNEVVNQNALAFGYHTSYKIIDRGIIEMLGPYGLSNLVSTKGTYLSRLQTGYVYHYAFLMLVGITFLVISLHLSTAIDARLVLIFILAILITHFSKQK